MVLFAYLMLIASNIYSLLGWNSEYKENKRLKEQLADSQNKLLEVQDNIIVDDIKLKDVRYIIEKQEIVEVVVEGAFIINNEVYIQSTPASLEYLNFEKNVKICTVNNWTSRIQVTAVYKKFIESFWCHNEDYSDITSIGLIQHLKEKVFRDSPKQIKLSDTYSFKEEAELVLQERKDKDFEFKLKQLEEGYNKDLDTILKQN